MKIRIGYGLGTRTKLNDERFADTVDALERLRFDSLWLSERLGGEAPDPIVGMAFAAGRTQKLKFGTSVLVLPGRNPVVLAKELASLDRLSGGRLLPAFGLGVADPHEQQAFGVARGDRAAWFDEALPLIRRLWLEDSVDHDGPRFHFEALRVIPKPLQQPPDVWLGGLAPSELRRVGRLGDGWLPSFIVPAEVATGRATIAEVAEQHGRSIDPEHYGVLARLRHERAPARVPHVAGQAPPRPRPDRAHPRRPADPRPTPRGLHRGGRLEVRRRSLRRACPATHMADHLAEVADALLPLQT